MSLIIFPVESTVPVGTLELSLQLRLFFFQFFSWVWTILFSHLPVYCAFLVWLTIFDPRYFFISVNTYLRWVIVQQFSSGYSLILAVEFSIVKIVLSSISVFLHVEAFYRCWLLFPNPLKCLIFSRAYKKQDVPFWQGSWVMSFLLA